MCGLEWPIRYSTRMAKGGVVRFGVGDPTGPHGQVWRLWVDKSGDSGYLACHNLGAYIKVSFHKRAHLSGFTTEERRHMRDAGMSVPRRFEWQPPPEQTPGYRRYMLIVEPASEVSYLSSWPNPERVMWLPAPPAGHAVEFQIWETPWFEGMFQTTSTTALWSAPMSDNRALRLTYRTVEFNTPYLVGEIEKFRKMAWSVAGVREMVSQGRDIGMFVEATWDQTGDPFWLHVVAREPERGS